MTKEISGPLNSRSTSTIEATMHLHNAFFDDDLLNPLNHGGKEYDYLSMNTDAISESTTEIKHKQPGHAVSSVINLEVSLSLNGWKRVEQRTRYNMWDLLGDVGGFQDGLFLLGSMFVTTYANF